MTQIDGELMYEILKSIQNDMRLLKAGQSEIKHEIISLRLSHMSMQNDIHNIYGITARTDDRLDRIERRLELRELAEAQAVFQHQP